MIVATGVMGTYQAPGQIQIFRAPEDRPSRLLAILVHEMCHHVLHHFQIKAPAGLDEERMTDAASIYFNFTPMMIPEYEQMFVLEENRLSFFKLGYLEAKELARANRFARSIQAGEQDLMSLVESDGFRVRKDSLGRRFTLPLDVPFHGVVSLHEQDRLRFRAYDLLAGTPVGAPPPEIVFISNKVVTRFGRKTVETRAKSSRRNLQSSVRSRPRKIQE